MDTTQPVNSEPSPSSAPTNIIHSLSGVYSKSIIDASFLTPEPRNQPSLFKMIGSFRKEHYTHSPTFSPTLSPMVASSSLNSSDTFSDFESEFTPLDETESLPPNTRLYEYSSTQQLQKLLYGLIDETNNNVYSDEDGEDEYEQFN
jgi:hypothetical protein